MRLPLSCTSYSRDAPTTNGGYAQDPPSQNPIETTTTTDYVKSSEKLLTDRLAALLDDQDSEFETDFSTAWNNPLPNRLPIYEVSREDTSSADPETAFVYAIAPDQLSEATSLQLAINSSDHRPNCVYSPKENYSIPLDPSYDLRGMQPPIARPPPEKKLPHKKKSTTKKKAVSATNLDGTPRKLRVPVKWTPKADAALIETIHLVSVSEKTGQPH